MKMMPSNKDELAFQRLTSAIMFLVRIMAHVRLTNVRMATCVPAKKSTMALNVRVSNNNNNNNNNIIIV